MTQKPEHQMKLTELIKKFQQEHNENKEELKREISQQLEYYFNVVPAEKLNMR